MGTIKEVYFLARQMYSGLPLLSLSFIGSKVDHLLQILLAHQIRIPLSRPSLGIYPLKGQDYTIQLAAKTLPRPRTSWLT